MTLAELQAKRDAILASAGEAAIRFGDREIRFAWGDKRAAELALIDAEIAKLQGQAARQFTIQTSRGL
jgi:hypothetical protein